MRLLLLLLFPLRILARVATIAARRLAERLRFPSSAWIHLELGGDVVELRRGPSPRERLLAAFGLGEPPAAEVAALRRTIDHALRRPKVEGLLVELGPLEVGRPVAALLAAELARARAGNKKVVVHVARWATDAEYVVAAAADEIWLGPVAPIAVQGAASAGLYLAGLLEKLGVKVEVAARGRFKSAPDRFVRAERSAADREQVTELVRDFDQALLAAIADGRKVDLAEARARIEAGPSLGAGAVARGLADRIVRGEDLPDALLERFGPERELVEPEAMYEPGELPPILGRRKRRVGIVEVHGAIVDLASRATSWSGRAAVAGEVVADLRAALADPRIGAVVLWVDSRGGSVTASDAIYAAVRRLAAEKPVVAYLGEVAASGGYYVAAGAHEIVASPLTITGSIGVFSMFPTWPALAARLGLGHDLVKELRLAGLPDPFRGATDDDRALQAATVDAMYAAFTGLVKEHRGLSDQALAEVTEGRVFTGRRAREVGLVDALGSLADATARARARAEGRFGEAPVIVRTRRPRPLPGPRPSAPAARLALELAALVASGSVGPFAWSDVPST